MEAFELDKTDIAILNHLQEDGRKSFTDISEETKLSVGTIRNRYNRLVESNILHIIGWIDPTIVGNNTYARVNLVIKPSSLKQAVAERLMKIPEVSFLAFTAGQYDIEVNLICKHNQQLVQIMNDHMYNVEGVHEINTTTYLQVLKWANHDVNTPITKNGSSSDK